jgi:hypothetical protein
MKTNILHKISAISVLAIVLGAAATTAHADQVQARVIDSTPVVESNGRISYYDVTYEFAGHQYTTRTRTRPGANIWVEADGHDTGDTPPAVSQQDWNHAVPEQGVVVSGGGAVAPAPVYVQPGPVYVQPAPIYYPPAYPYYSPGYVWPPVGISLGFGYSRGWGGGPRGGWGGGPRGGWGGGPRGGWRH